MSELEAEVVATLHTLQRSIMKHPMAAQALFAALIAEGREYAATPEGARLRDRLARSRTIHRARIAWDVATMNVLGDHEPGLMPSALVEALARAGSLADLEQRLADLMEDGRG
jgi:hypothetical protein